MKKRRGGAKFHYEFRFFSQHIRPCETVPELRAAFGWLWMLLWFDLKLQVLALSTK